jgi:hypothetical protein
MTVCYSGAASGEHCGFTVGAYSRTAVFSRNGRRYRIAHEWRASRRRCPSTDGDSGAPVYVKRHGKAYAVGMLSGAAGSGNGCPLLFTALSTSLQALHLRLLIAS